MEKNKLNTGAASIVISPQRIPISGSIAIKPNKGIRARSYLRNFCCNLGNGNSKTIKAIHAPNAK